VKIRRSHKPLFATAVFSIIALLAAACGSSTDEGTTGASTSPAAAPQAGLVSSIAAQVPADVKADGTLKVAADATYAPNEFIASDGKTVVGLDADLAKALGQVLGLKVNVVNATFETIIPGLASGKYDLGISSFTDTKEREQTVDFVTYFVAGTSFYVKSSGGPNIKSLADLCGRTVAAERGTTQAADAQEQAAKCKSAGKPTATLQVYNDQNAVNLALSSGRAHVAMADSPVAAYQVKASNGVFKVTGSPYGTAPYGIAIPKDSGMVDPVLAAVKHLMADGTYNKILDRWGVRGGAISNPAVNAAVS
jgi:polar amino acid transport system substrate-binding protein